MAASNRKKNSGAFAVQYAPILKPKNLIPLGVEPSWQGDF
jgi:hypothetical protein